MPTTTSHRPTGDERRPGLDLVARAVSDPSRRRILELIRHEEYTVGQIAERFPVSRPAISQHLRVLEAAELVEIRSSGRCRYYRSRPEGLNSLRSWLDGFWTGRLDRLKEEVEQEHRRRTERVDGGATKDNEGDNR